MRIAQHSAAQFKYCGFSSAVAAEHTYTIVTDTDRWNISFVCFLIDSNEFLHGQLNLDNGKLFSENCERWVRVWVERITEIRVKCSYFNLHRFYFSSFFSLSVDGRVDSVNLIRFNSIRLISFNDYIFMDLYRERATITIIQIFPSDLL